MPTIDLGEPVASMMNPDGARPNAAKFPAFDKNLGRARLCRAVTFFQQIESRLDSHAYHKRLRLIRASRAESPRYDSLG
jgi:hypothetical protein